jgi:ATP-dependent Clp protease adaptor protein ClpS
MADAIEQPGQPTVHPGKPKAQPAQRPRMLPMWNVILLDDDDHTYDYVIEMLINLFGHTLERGFHTARKVDKEGRAIVFTGHREVAELKLEQIHGFGIDPRIAACRGSMNAVLEPAE